MDNSIKAILIGASVVIALVTVSLSFLILRQGQDTAKNAVNRIDSMNSSLAESDYTLYDGLEVSGSEVLNTIRKFRDDYLAIQVITGENESGAWYLHDANIDTTTGTAEIGAEKDFNLSNAIEPSNVEYINPNGRFQGSVLRDSNGAVSVIKFEQK